MNNFPFFRFPYNNYYRYYNYKNNMINNNLNHPYSTVEKKHINEKTTNFKENTEKLEKNINKSSKHYFGPIIFDDSSFSDLEKPVLEVLGLKLYLDDILIISLLYFLYEENVKDDVLFISLILLLLS